MYLTVSLCSDNTAAGQYILMDAYPAADSTSTTCTCSAIAKSTVQNSLVVAPVFGLKPSTSDCGTRFDLSVQSDSFSEEISSGCSNLNPFNLLIGLQATVNITYTKIAKTGIEDNSYCIGISLFVHGEYKEKSKIAKTC